MKKITKAGTLMIRLKYWKYNYKNQIIISQLAIQKNKS